MTSVDEVLENYETSNHKNDDTFITKKGSVVSMHLEEIREQKTRLERQLSDRDKQIEYLNEVISDLKKDMMQMRIRMGLPAEKPMAKGKCCTSEGYLLPGSYKPTPSLDEELGLRQN
jgi:uncharacterized coiled-coil protein SlyX